MALGGEKAVVHLVRLWARNAVVVAARVVGLVDGFANVLQTRHELAGLNMDWSEHRTPFAFPTSICTEELSRRGGARLGSSRARLASKYCYH